MQSGAIIEAADWLEALPYSEDYRECEHHHSCHDSEGGDGACLGARCRVICRVSVEHDGADTHEDVAAQRRHTTVVDVDIAAQCRGEILKSDMDVAAPLGAEQ